MNDSSEKLVTVAKYIYSLRAYLTRQRLEDEGIECFFLNENSLDRVLNYPNEGIELRVRENQYYKALDIIQKLKLEFGEDQLIDKVVNIKKILIPINFNEESLNACKYAVGLSEIFHSEIMLFHSYYLPMIEMLPMGDTTIYPPTIDENLTEIEIQSKIKMQEFADNLNQWILENSKSEIIVNQTLTKGIIEDEVFEFYKDYQPDLIIMGIKNNSEKNPEIFGNVASDVIENVKVPVLIIPLDSQYSEISELKNILYCTNFDQSDFKAIHKLIYLISPFKMKIHCLHVRSGNKDPWDSIKMDGLKDHLVKEFIDESIEVNIIENENIINAINHYVVEKNINIISMTTHKRGFLSRIFIPSITQKMMFHSKIPILVFHSK